MENIKKKHGGKSNDHGRNASYETEDNTRCRHQLDVPAPKAAPNKRGKQERHGCQYAEQLHRLEADQSGESNKQADSVGDNPLFDIDDRCRQKQGNKNAALHKERQISLHN